MFQYVLTIVIHVVPFLFSFPGIIFFAHIPVFTDRRIGYSQRFCSFCLGKSKCFVLLDFLVLFDADHFDFLLWLLLKPEYLYQYKHRHHLLVWIDKSNFTYIKNTRWG